MAMVCWQTWRAATTAALYGPEGFYRSEAPAAHFRTSVHVSPAFASALLRLARMVGVSTIVDVGAGGGELVSTLDHLAPNLTLVAVDVADRPADLPESVAWMNSVPDVIDALVVANEWLDDIPLDVAEIDGRGVVRLVEVDLATGDERLGSPVGRRDAAWLERWWPHGEPSPGTRAEIGWPRDDAWAQVVQRLGRGLAVAIDYGHVRTARPLASTLSGYRAGRTVAPVPDGSCDITSHVAIDAVGAAGERSGADGSILTRQRQALLSLGIGARRPARPIDHADPAAYVELLARAADASELVAPDGLGAFWWLLQTRDVALPPTFASMLSRARPAPGRTCT